MKIKGNYTHTIICSYIGYMTSAIANNFAPLLFITFRNEYSIELDKISFLITLNFAVQLTVDLLSTKFIDKIGYRTTIVSAQLLSAAGLAGLAILPGIFPSAYSGLLCAVFIYAIGGGLNEVLISPIVEACPTKNKAAIMSLAHSFYCWGHVFVVLISTLFFVTAGISHWKILALIWAVFPLFDAVYFSQVPILHINQDGNGMSIKELFTNKTFILILIIMLCAGASEQAMSQWASAFTESALNVSKTVGDLAGPCAFAVFMGMSRALYAKFSTKMKLEKFISVCCILCAVSYLTATLFSNPYLSLCGFALCGVSVGIFWPGTFSIASLKLRRGGTAMFALMALAGDMGCMAGPTLVGTLSSASGGNLKAGLLPAIIFPIVLLSGNILLNKKNSDLNDC